MKKIYIVAGVVVVLLIVLFWHKDSTQVVPINGGPIIVTLSGAYVCLSFIDTKMPNSEECVFGLKTDDGLYYMVNFGQSASAKAEFDRRARITAEGYVVPKEALSTDQWALYNMKGVFTITKMLK